MPVARACKPAVYFGKCCDRPGMEVGKNKPEGRKAFAPEPVKTCHVSLMLVGTHLEA